MYAPYSSDLLSSDYHHLFRSPQNSLNGVSLFSTAEHKNHLTEFFSSKNQTSFTLMGPWCYQKNGKMLLITMALIWSSNIILM